MRACSEVLEASAILLVFWSCAYLARSFMLELAVAALDAYITEYFLFPMCDADAIFCLCRLKCRDLLVGSLELLLKV